MKTREFKITEMAFAPHRKRFFSHIDSQPDGGCWLWKNTSPVEYGSFYFLGRTITAHRMSFAIHSGAIPAGMNVLHKCDNPRCVNPHHLFLGTRKDNSQDMVKKGRNWGGENWTKKQPRSAGFVMMIRLEGKHRAKLKRVAREKQRSASFIVSKVTESWLNGHYFLFEEPINPAKPAARK